MLSEVEQNRVEHVDEKSLVFSFKSLENKQRAISKLENYEQVERTTAHQSFTDEEFERFWDELTQKYHEENRKLVASNMELSERKRLEGEVFEVSFPSEGSKRMVEEELSNILNYLRYKLNNFKLNFQLVVNEQIEMHQTILTVEDKVKGLAEQYPSFGELIGVLDLMLTKD